MNNEEAKNGSREAGHSTEIRKKPFKIFQLENNFTLHFWKHQQIMQAKCLLQSTSL